MVSRPRKRFSLRLLFFALAISVLVALEVFYFLSIRNLISAYFSGDSPHWFGALAENLYPRLAIEKNRFEATFFISKTDQIALRFALLTLTVLLIFYSKKSQEFFTRFVFGKAQYHFEIKAWIQYALYAYFFRSNIGLSYEWEEILKEYAQISSLYSPISFYSFISPIFPEVRKIEESFELFYFINKVGLVLSLLVGSLIWIYQTPQMQRLSLPKISYLNALKTKKLFMFSQSVLLVLLLISSGFFIYLQGFLYGFGKVEHTYATWNWVCITLPLWHVFTFKETTHKTQNRLLFWAIGLIYCFSGLEKIFIGGISWLNGDALLNFLTHSQVPLGLELSHYPFLVTLLSVGVIVWEIGFIGILSSKKWLHYLLLGLGICFHASTYFFIGVGHYFSPWIWGYVFLMVGKRKV